MRNDEATRDGEADVVPERQRMVHVFNKADLLPDPEAFLAQVRERFPHAVLTSTVATPQDDRAGIPHSAFRVPHSGVDALRTVLRTSAQALRPIARIRVPVANGRLLAELHREAEVLVQRAEDGAMVVTARVEAPMLGRLRREGVEVELPGAGSREPDTPTRLSAPGARPLPPEQ